MKTKDNQRRIHIEKCICSYFPKDITKLISIYDYYLEGEFRTINSGDYISHNKIEYVALLPDGRIVASVDFYNICIWNPETESPDHYFRAGNSFISFINVLSDGRIMSGSYDATIKIWKFDQDVTCELIFEEHACVVKDIGILSDGLIISKCYNRFPRSVFKIWNAQTGICDTTFESMDKCITILPDGRIVSVTKNETNEIEIWRHGEYNLRKTFENRLSFYFTNIVTELFDGRIIVGYYSKNLIICDQKNLENDIILKGHSDFVICINILPDGRIVSGSKDKTLKIWNPYNGNCEMTLIGHTDTVCCIAVYPDGRIISGSADGTIKMWY
jgi:WD40 repeat protein